MANLVFNKLKEDLADGDFSLSANYYWILVTAAPTDPTVTARSSLTEATGGNYAVVAASGVAIGSSGNTRFVDADDVVWTSLTSNGTATVGVVLCLRAGGSPSTSDTPYVYNEFSSSYTPNGATLTVPIAATGIFTITQG